MAYEIIAEHLVDPLPGVFRDGVFDLDDLSVLSSSTAGDDVDAQLDANLQLDSLLASIAGDKAPTWTSHDSDAGRQSPRVAAQHPALDVTAGSTQAGDDAGLQHAAGAAAGKEKSASLAVFLDAASGASASGLDDEARGAAAGSTAVQQPSSEPQAASLLDAILPAALASSDAERLRNALSTLAIAFRQLELRQVEAEGLIQAARDCEEAARMEAAECARAAQRERERGGYLLHLLMTASAGTGEAAVPAGVASGGAAAPGSHAVGSSRVSVASGSASASLLDDLSTIDRVTVDRMTVDRPRPATALVAAGSIAAAGAAAASGVGAVAVRDSAADVTDEAAGAAAANTAALLPLLPSLRLLRGEALHAAMARLDDLQVTLATRDRELRDAHTAIAHASAADRAQATAARAEVARLNRELAAAAAIAHVRCKEAEAARTAAEAEAAQAATAASSAAARAAAAEAHGAHLQTQLAEATNSLRQVRERLSLAEEAVAVLHSEVAARDAVVAQQAETIEQLYVEARRSGVGGGSSSQWVGRGFGHLGPALTSAAAGRIAAGTAGGAAQNALTPHPAASCDGCDTARVALAAAEAEKVALQQRLVSLEASIAGLMQAVADAGASAACAPHADDSFASEADVHEPISAAAAAAVDAPVASTFPDRDYGRDTASVTELLAVIAELRAELARERSLADERVAQRERVLRLEADARVTVSRFEHSFLSTSQSMMIVGAGPRHQQQHSAAQQSLDATTASGDDVNSSRVSQAGAGGALSGGADASHTMLQLSQSRIGDLASPQRRSDGGAAGTAASPRAVLGVGAGTGSGARAALASGAGGSASAAGTLAGSAGPGAAVLDALLDMSAISTASSTASASGRHGAAPGDLAGPTHSEGASSAAVATPFSAAAACRGGNGGDGADVAVDSSIASAPLEVFDMPLEVHDQHPQAAAPAVVAAHEPGRFRSYGDAVLPPHAGAAASRWLDFDGLPSSGAASPVLDGIAADIGDGGGGGAAAGEGEHGEWVDLQAGRPASAVEA